MRIVRPGVALLALVLTVLTAAPTSAAVAPDVEATIGGLVNAEREAAGLAPLTVVTDLTAAARAHATRMADAQDLHHNPDLATAVSGWQQVGENVGRGPQARAVHEAFMASPSHRANVLDPDYTQLGVGVDERDGRLWITQLFRLPARSGPEPVPSAPPTAAADTDAGGDDDPAATGRTALVLAQVESHEQAIPVDSLLG